MESTSEGIAHIPRPFHNGDRKFGHRLKLGVGFAVLIVALGYFAFMAFESATVYYYTVGELQELPVTDGGRMVRVSGKLLPGSFLREPGSIQATFTLTDGTETMVAIHDGVLPGLFFNEHSEIILEGSYSPGGPFKSHNVIVKCPSKYIAAS